MINMNQKVDEFKKNLILDTASEYFKKLGYEKTQIDKISKDLKKRGMKFVGTTIIYSYLQAIGIINSHDKDCFMYKK